MSGRKIGMYQVCSYVEFRLLLYIIADSLQTFVTELRKAVFVKVVGTQFLIDGFTDRFVDFLG
jgi:hypothetical protein